MAWVVRCTAGEGAVEGGGRRGARGREKSVKKSKIDKIQMNSFHISDSLRFFFDSFRFKEIFFFHFNEDHDVYAKYACVCASEQAY